MNYILIINTAVSLIMGCALVLVGRGDPSQSFTRYLGWANLIQLLVPTSYWLTSQASPDVATIGFFTIALISAGYTTLLVAGTGYLADRPLNARTLWVILAVIGAVNGAAIGIDGLRLGQASVATINTVLGVVCTFWLWRDRATRFSLEILVGPLLIMLGLIQFIFVI